MGRRRAGGERREKERELAREIEGGREGERYIVCATISGKMFQGSNRIANHVSK